MNKIDYYKLSLAQLNEIKRELNDVIQDKVRTLTKTENDQRNKIIEWVKKNPYIAKSLMIKGNDCVRTAFCYNCDCSYCKISHLVDNGKEIDLNEYEVSLKAIKKPLTKLLYSRAHQKP